MNERFATTLWLIGYTFLVGLMLAIFSILDDLIRYLFSLLAIYIGIRFFRRFETLGMRIAFFVMGIVFYLVIAVLIAAVQYIRENQQGIMGA